MDQARFEELKKKADGAGLTDEEAGELGKLFAEEEGTQYSNADDLRAEEAETATALDEEVKREEEADTLDDEGGRIDRSPSEERGAGTERMPMGATGGYLPPKGSDEVEGDEEGDAQT
ncbi:MAG TPA: hypothetical protein DIT48_02415 [Actinobacteria bacterium]|jgi:hypothetical protein|nr:hypothetical protein [Actinomycetota bacterium]HCP61299.1 hypothetical protein [Actinomycetota bacterium]